MLGVLTSFSSQIIQRRIRETSACKNRRTQNSGVMTKSTHKNCPPDFYGILKEIIRLEYNGNERSVVLFKCDWFKLDGKKTELKDDGYFKSINSTSLSNKKDSLILVTQARKVFYIPDTMNGKNWQIVQTFDHRHLYNVAESEGVFYNALAYQDDECCEVQRGQKPVSEFTSEQPLNRENEQGTSFEAAEITALMEEHRGMFDSDSDNEQDDTYGILQCK
jgi:hypothetical protein